MMTSDLPVRFRFLLASAMTALALPALICGCAAPQYVGFTRVADMPADMAFVPGIDSEHRDFTPRFIDGRTGGFLAWSDVQDSLDWADVIFLGERHGDAVGHQAQHLIVRDVLERHSGSAVSMEMFERDRQIFVDDYLDDIIDLETMMESARVGGWPDWPNNYQPTVDAAKEFGATVVAANAPRRYVRMARLEGYERLRELSAEQRRTFDIPRKLDEGDYWRRFQEVMSHGHAVVAQEDNHDSEQDEQETEAERQAREQRIRAAFRSQQLWDATMAASIARALDAGARKVVHLNGGFHSDFEGGTVSQFRRHKPRARVLTISTVPVASDTLRQEDVGRADIVIYTGDPREPEPDSDEADTDTDD